MVITQASSLGRVPVRPVRAAGPDGVGPARPLEPLPTRAQLAALCAAPSRDSFFALSNRLFAEKRPVRELPREFAHHPDPAVQQAYRIASQELGRSAMSEMERQERVNGGYEAITFLLGSAPAQVEDSRVTDILDRLPQNDLTLRFCLRMIERVPSKAALFAARLEGLPSRGQGPVYGVRDGVLLRGEPDDPTGLAAFPYGKLEEAAERMADPALREQFESEREHWLGLADRWEERGIDDRFGWNGVYGLELYAAMAEHFPHWKPEERIAPLLAQKQAHDGHGMDWLRTLPLPPVSAGKARFQLMREAVERGHQLTAAEKHELLGWFQPLHQGMIHLPWDWNGCRAESLKCLQACLPQLEGEKLTGLPVREALREHLLAGPDTDLTLTFESHPETLLAVLEHPRLEEALRAELPDTMPPSWKDLPQRARNALALLSMQGKSVDLGPMASRYQDRQDVFVAPQRREWVARQLQAGRLESLLEMARDRRLRPDLVGHPAPPDPSCADWLKERLTPGTPELALASALAPTFPELAEGVERVVLQNPGHLTPEVRPMLALRLATGAHAGEKRRQEVLRLLGSGALPAWRAGASGWVGEVCRRLPTGPDETVAESVGLLLGEEDPGRVARELLDRVQSESLLSGQNRDAEVFHGRVSELVALRREGRSLEQALQAVQPPRETGGGSIAVREDAVVVGGTRLKLKHAS